MRQPSELSYHDLQRIVQSIQRFLYIDRDDAGREIWGPDKEWSGADVCEHLAHILSLHHLVPEASRPVAGQPYPYSLDPIDGPAFRRQRQLLLNLATLAREGETYRASSVDQELLDGLVDLTDAITDQAHDKHSVDCLLEPAD